MKRVSDETLAEMTRRLVARFQPEQIILFGSQAWGTPSLDSDVDVLVIVADSDLSAYERAVEGHRALRGLDIAKDVIVKTRAEFDFFRDVPASLEHRIAEQGRVLYERGEKPTRAELAATSPA